MRKGNLRTKVKPDTLSSVTEYFHVATRVGYEGALESGQYTPEGFAAEGFIHLCTQEQLPEVRARFQDKQRLVLLVIAAESIANDVRFENLYGHGEYPHLYSPLPVSAIVRVEQV